MRDSRGADAGQQRRDGDDDLLRKRKILPEMQLRDEQYRDRFVQRRPSILTVAPNGKTNEPVLLLIPARCSTLDMVSGSVPLLLALLNAVNSAGDIALANASGLRLATNFKISGSVINAWTANAKLTANHIPSQALRKFPVLGSP